jgi:Alpha-glucuronidase
VHYPAQELMLGMLPELAAFAGLLRPFGVRLMLSADFSMPLRYGLDTADTLDEGVQHWWRDRAESVWKAIPDFAGFMVKADSEHRPGPNAYGRTHAEGANMLARAIAPFGGTLIWRAFVYDCMQDWRDTKTDRAKAAYELYKPLDGCFDENVVLQVKHGPFDFQVREPVSPLLLSMPRTRLALEVQLAQEYTGQQTDIYAMPPMWREVFDTVGKDRVKAFTAVSNLGRDANWTGHPFAALNLFAFGRFAWDPDTDPEQVTRLWVRLTYSLETAQEGTLVKWLMRSRRIYEKYTSNLGLGWMVTPNSHYGPNPWGYEFQAWGTYNRADREKVGIDRTFSGTDYVGQYPEKMKNEYADPKTCPDDLLLFFHRLSYGYVMRDGRSLIQRIYDDHFDGYREAEEMAEELLTLPLPPEDMAEVRERMLRQLANAREWRDVTNTFFRRLSGAEDAQGRKIFA